MEKGPKVNNVEQKAYNTKDILSFDEFISKKSNGIIIYNNFPSLFYRRGMFSEILRNQDFFRKFREENPELENYLSDTLSKLALSGFYTIPDEVMQKLYEAYKIMLSYEEVKANDDLFK